MLSPDFPSLEIKRNRGVETAIFTIAVSILIVVPVCMGLLIADFDCRRAGLLAFVSVTVAVICCWRLGWLGTWRAIAKASLDIPSNSPGNSAGQWWLFDTNGVRWEASLRDDSYLVGSIIWLRFDSEKGVRQLLLVDRPHSPDRDALRRLRVRLRLTNTSSMLATNPAVLHEDAEEGLALAESQPQRGFQLAMQRIRSLRL